MKKTINSPLVSILIPMYNSEAHISETLDSCLNQIYKNIEIIIVDDESTDRSSEICKNYVSKYNFIFLYKQKNSGAPKARNYAFYKSKGKYIQYLDADDVLSKDKISSQVEQLFFQKDTTISYCRYSRFHEGIESSILNKCSESINYSKPISFLNHLLNTGWLQTSCWLVSRELVEANGEWREDLSRNQDGDFFGRIIMNSKKGVFSKEGMVYYRVSNPNSITAKKKDVKYFESYVRSFYHTADLCVSINEKQEKYPLAKVINGFCEKLILLNSPEVIIGFNKINELGFRNLNELQHPTVKYLKYFLGYKNSIRIKFKILHFIKK